MEINLRIYKLFYLQNSARRRAWGLGSNQLQGQDAQRSVSMTSSRTRAFGRKPGLRLRRKLDSESSFGADCWENMPDCWLRRRNAGKHPREV